MPPSFPPSRSGGLDGASLTIFSNVFFLWRRNSNLSDAKTPLLSCRRKIEVSCRRKIEESPGVQSRDDTPVGGGRDESERNCFPAVKSRAAHLIAPWIAIELLIVVTGE